MMFKTMNVAIEGTQGGYYPTSGTQIYRQLEQYRAPKKSSSVENFMPSCMRLGLRNLQPKLNRKFINNFSNKKGIACSCGKVLPWSGLVADRTNMVRI